MKKSPITILCLLLSLSLASCALTFSEASPSSSFPSAPESTSAISYLGEITLSGEKNLTVGEQETLEVSLPGAKISCLEEGMVTIENDVVTTLKSGTATLIASAEGYEDGILELEIMPTLQEIRSDPDGTAFKAKGSVKAISNEGYLLEDYPEGEGYLFIEEPQANYLIGEEVLLSAILKKSIAPSGLDLKAVQVLSSSLSKGFVSDNGGETTLTGELFNAYAGETMERYLIHKATASLSSGLLSFFLPLLSGSRRKAILHYQGAAPLEGTYDLLAYFTNVLENGVVEGFLIQEKEYVASEPKSLNILSSKSGTLAPGESLQFSANALPYDALQEVSWSIDDTSGNFAISQDGLLSVSPSAPLESMVQLTATSLWAENPLSATIDLRVVEKTSALR